MSQQDSDEVAFHDVSAYFSKEEWKLLHEWQKELYRNVMKEIHQALISLGPLIATTVFSLRAKEKEEMCPMDNKDFDRRQRMNHSPTIKVKPKLQPYVTGEDMGDMMDNDDVLFRINKEEHLHVNTPQNSERRERNDGLSSGFPFLNTDIRVRKEEAVSIFIDHLGAEIGESSTTPNSEHDVVTFHINNEEETFCMDHQDSTRIESINSPTGDGSMKREKRVAESIQCIKRTAPRKASSGKKNVKVHKSSLKGTNSRSKLWSEGFWEGKAEKTTQFESDFSHSEKFNLYQGRPNVGIPEKYNECESNLCNTLFIDGLPNTQQIATSYTCSECDKSYSEKAAFMKHLGTHSRARPYVCTECDKSFFQKPTLIKHLRTHSGEKPYPCTFCHKRFSRKDNLNGHMRIHSGERPYKCTECEKCFTWKGDLNQHRRRAHKPQEQLLLQRKA